MRQQHEADWAGAGRMLEQALEHYWDLKGYDTWTQVVHDVANFMPGRQGGGLSEKTIRRDIAGSAIPSRRVELWVRWLHDRAKLPRGSIAEWLELTDHPYPGELLARVCQAEGDRYQVYAGIKKNEVPSLRGHLWGDFLGREQEIEEAIAWANLKPAPLAVLWGFGGNGKTTIQLKLGEDFVYGPDCPLRWPFEGVIWVSARDTPTLPTLHNILFEVVKTFNPPENLAGLGGASPIWLKQEARKILRQKRVLILLDDFETIPPPSDPQAEILESFGWLGGTSQTLISSRYRLDLNIAHVLIPVAGLSAEDAATLIQDYLQAQALSQLQFTPDDLKRLVEVTQNNPKAILAVLGMVQEGVSLSRLLDHISLGAPEADQVFSQVIGNAWQNILTRSDQWVLMAKSFFSQPVREADLGLIADVNASDLIEAINKLRTISFFERPRPTDTRIRTHPLAQDFAHRILHTQPGFERQAEQRWWSDYVNRVVEQALQASYADLLANPKLNDDVTNVLDRLEKHLREASQYVWPALELFANRARLGNALLSWGRWEEMLNLATLALDIAIRQDNPRLIGRCLLRLISSVHRERHELDQAEAYVAQATELNVTLQDQWLRAAIEEERAHLHRRRGYFKAAKQAYQNVFRIYLELDEVADIGLVLTALGGVTVDIALAPQTEAIDPLGQLEDSLKEAEQYFLDAEYYWQQLEPADPSRRFAALTLRSWQGVIARVRGDFDEARRLFNECIGQFQSLLAVAHVYRELALVEYLAGNTDLAHKYEEQGLIILQRQLGIGVDSKQLPPSNCYKVIERLKNEERW